MDLPFSARIVVFATRSMERLMGPQLLLRITRLYFRAHSAVGAAIGAKYVRFIGLKDSADAALSRGNCPKAERLARELLQLAEQFPDDWNHGNAIHHGNKVLGLCALRAGRVAEARAHLIASGRTSGSPQLESFGPSMRLAAELLEHDAKESVLLYLEDCRTFWQVDVRDEKGVPFAGPARLDAWAAAIRQGTIPDFRPNVGY
jgi:hypothetical protein